jgi:hypothetical protein
MSALRITVTQQNPSRSLLIGSARERKAYTEANDKPDGAQFAQMLGPGRIADLTTGEIRHWHKTLTSLVSSHTANRAKAVLRSALALKRLEGSAGQTSLKVRAFEASRVACVSIGFQ